MDPRDHHDELFEAALERMLGLDRTDPADLADRLEKLLEADMDEMPARNESSQLRAAVLHLSRKRFEWLATSLVTFCAWIAPISPGFLDAINFQFKP